MFEIKKTTKQKTEIIKNGKEKKVITKDKEEVHEIDTKGDKLGVLEKIFNIFKKK